MSRSENPSPGLSLNGEDTIHHVFDGLKDLPAWNVRRGHGSFITFEFGTPRLEIREPRPAGATSSPEVARLRAKRLVFVKGDFHLWIYICQWRLIQDGTELANWESEDEVIERAVPELDGQKLVRCVIDPSNGTTIFDFDLGGRLETSPVDDENDEQWLLYCKGDGQVLVYRGDGSWRLAPSNGAPDDHDWVRLTDVTTADLSSQP